MLHDRSNRASKDDSLIGLPVKQWLDSDTITDEEQFPSLKIVNGKGEHPAQALGAFSAPVLPGRHEDFGITLGLELKAMALEFVLGGDARGCMPEEWAGAEEVLAAVA